MSPNSTCCTSWVASAYFGRQLLSLLKAHGHHTRRSDQKSNCSLRRGEKAAVSKERQMAMKPASQGSSPNSATRQSEQVGPQTFWCPVLFCDGRVLHLSQSCACSPVTGGTGALGECQLRQAESLCNFLKASRQPPHPASTHHPEACSCSLATLPSYHKLGGWTHACSVLDIRSLQWVSRG